MLLQWHLGYLLVCHYGRWYQVVAIFTNVEDANTFMTTHPDTSVLAHYGNSIILVNTDDLGRSLEDYNK